LINERLDSCLILASGSCPYQLWIARLYLIPQLLSFVESTTYENACLECKQHVNRFVNLAESEIDDFS
jgi:hypothetical protein